MLYDNLVDSTILLKTLAKGLEWIVVELNRYIQNWIIALHILGDKINLRFCPADTSGRHPRNNYIVFVSAIIPQ
jgi:hypothetical protein